MHRSGIAAAAAAWLAFAPALVMGADQAPAPAEKKPEVKEAVPASSVTKHQITIDGKAIKYTATVDHDLVLGDRGRRNGFLHVSFLVSGGGGLLGAHGQRRRERQPGSGSRCDTGTMHR